MGLNVSHGAFNAAYSTFNNFRRAILKSYNGMDLFEFKGFEGVARKGEEIKYMGFVLEDYVFSDGLLIFLNHSDCEGEISHADAYDVANALTFFIGKIEGYEYYLSDFIYGCMEAYVAKENLTFS